MLLLVSNLGSAPPRSSFFATCSGVVLGMRRSPLLWPGESLSGRGGVGVVRDFIWPLSSSGEHQTGQSDQIRVLHGRTYLPRPLNPKSSLWFWLSPFSLRLFMDSGLFWSAPAKRRGHIEPQRRRIPVAGAGNPSVGFPTRRSDGAFPWLQMPHASPNPKRRQVRAPGHPWD